MTEWVVIGLSGKVRHAVNAKFGPMIPADGAVAVRMECGRFAVTWRPAAPTDKHTCRACLAVLEPGAGHVGCGDGGDV